MKGDKKRTRGRGGQKQPRNKSHDQPIRQPRKQSQSDPNSDSNNHDSPTGKDAPHQGASHDYLPEEATGKSMPRQATGRLEVNNQHQFDARDVEDQKLTSMQYNRNKRMVNQHASGANLVPKSEYENPHTRENEQHFDKNKQLDVKECKGADAKLYEHPNTKHTEILEPKLNKEFEVEQTKGLNIDQYRNISKEVEENNGIHNKSLKSNPNEHYSKEDVEFDVIMHHEYSKTLPNNQSDAKGKDKHDAKQCKVSVEKENCAVHNEYIKEDINGKHTENIQLEVQNELFEDKKHENLYVVQNECPEEKEHENLNVVQSECPKDKENEEHSKETEALDNMDDKFPQNKKNEDLENLKVKQYECLGAKQIKQHTKQNETLNAVPCLEGVKCLVDSQCLEDVQTCLEEENEHVMKSEHYDAVLGKEINLDTNKEICVKMRQVSVKLIDEQTVEESKEQIVKPMEVQAIKPREKPAVKPSKEPAVKPSEEPAVEPRKEPAVELREEPAVEPREESAVEPSEEPAVKPSEEPAVEPREEPAVEPRKEPAVELREEPAVEPREESAVEPSEEPAVKPSEEPAVEPSEEPAIEPSEEPAVELREEPAVEQREEPAVEPSEEKPVEQSEEPAVEPRDEPAVEPSEEPAVEPSEEPAVEPSEEPAVEPREEPAVEPSEEQAVEPREEPAIKPREEPAVKPREEPAVEPREESAVEPREESAVEPREESAVESIKVPAVEPREEPAVEPREEPAIKPREEPAVKPREEPAVKPREEPAVEPREEPAVEPSEKPAVEPREEPAVEPREESAVEPKEEPTVEPREEPAVEPREEPAVESREEPAVEPREEPAVEPSKKPAVEPREEPAVEPREESAVEPKEEPTVEPSEEPAVEPREEPAVEPREEPAVEPREEPAIKPREESAVEPREEPAVEPSEKPAVEQSEEPDVEPSEEPAIKPREESAVEPREEPAVEPREEPAVEPREEPAVEPREEPAVESIKVPAVKPSEKPAVESSEEPAVEPREEPAVEPIRVPAVKPSEKPAVESSEEPAVEPREEPAVEPREELAIEVNEEPTVEQSEEPDVEPSEEPAVEPSEEPAVEPREEPAVEPRDEPAVEPNEEPAVEPREEPAVEPNEKPAVEPSEEPAVEPREEPAVEPSKEPAVEPSEEHAVESSEGQAVKSSEGLPIKPSNEEAIKESEHNGKVLFSSQGNKTHYDGSSEDKTKHLEHKCLQECDQTEVGKTVHTYVIKDSKLVNKTDCTQKELITENEGKEHIRNQKQDLHESNSQGVERMEDRQNAYCDEHLNSKMDNKPVVKPNKVDSPQRDKGEQSSSQLTDKQHNGSQEKNSNGYHMPSQVQHEIQKSLESESCDGRQQKLDMQIGSQKVRQWKEHPKDTSTSVLFTVNDEAHLHKDISQEQEMGGQKLNTKQASAKDVAQKHVITCSSNQNNDNENSNTERNDQKSGYMPNAYQRMINEKTKLETSEVNSHHDTLDVVNEHDKKDEVQTRGQEEKQVAMPDVKQHDGQQECFGHNNHHYNKKQNENRHVKRKHQEYWEQDPSNYSHLHGNANYGSYHQQRSNGQYGRQNYRGAHSPNYYGQQHKQQQHARSQVADTSRKLCCDNCNENYNCSNKKPRILHCRHSICSECAQTLLINTYKTIVCPFCNRQTWYVHDIDKLPYNHSILKGLQEQSAKPIVTIGKNDGSGNQKCVTKQSFTGEKSYRATPEHAQGSPVTVESERKQCKPVLPQNGSRSEMHTASPHNSQCLEFRARPSFHCANCQQWVCDKCGQIDHNERKGCVLIPLRDTLTQMKQQHENSASATCSTLNTATKELKNSCDDLDVFLLSMRAALECIEREHKNLKEDLQEGIQKERSIKDSVVKLPECKNLPESLAGFKDVEACCAASQEWISRVASRDSSNEAKNMTKALIRFTLQSIRRFTVEDGKLNEIVAIHEGPSTRFSVPTVRGGRIHLHCLTSSVPVESSQKLPLECFKSCLDKNSSLAFLDLSWNGSPQGRIYIRMTGDTVRGRQFLMLCTGEMGPSFCNTHFHRVWWKGYPGEHIWGGDINHGDGSGAVTLISDFDSEQTTELGRSVSITAGLVAGRYEKKNPSSIFRIYTKDAKNTEEAAFGQVEFGLDIIQKAVSHNNIHDVIISDCGIVLEL
ncbi:titin homolog [Procambarus clarkii]|uniref:titin homolog n=1 Tax=Procambarus clarkii TaxID=6728 RepID=UPI001E670D18|nr:titin-like [Procambarus clarkii]